VIGTSHQTFLENHPNLASLYGMKCITSYGVPRDNREGALSTCSWQFGLGMHLFRQAERETLRVPQPLVSERLVRRKNNIVKPSPGSVKHVKSTTLVDLPFGRGPRRGALRRERRKGRSQPPPLRSSPAKVHENPVKVRSSAVKDFKVSRIVEWWDAGLPVEWSSNVWREAKASQEFQSWTGDYTREGDPIYEIETIPATPRVLIQPGGVPVYGDDWRIIARLEVRYRVPKEGYPCQSNGHYHNPQCRGRVNHGYSGGYFVFDLGCPISRLERAKFFRKRNRRAVRRIGTNRREKRAAWFKDMLSLKYPTSPNGRLSDKEIRELKGKLRSGSRKVDARSKPKSLKYNPFWSPPMVSHRTISFGVSNLVRRTSGSKTTFHRAVSLGQVRYGVDSLPLDAPIVLKGEKLSIEFNQAASTAVEVAEYG